MTEQISFVLRIIDAQVCSKHCGLTFVELGHVPIQNEFYK